MRARRAMGAASYANALLTMVRRNRRRYGGYVVHAASRCCCSAWRRRRPSTPSATSRLRPGQTHAGRRLRRALRQADVRPLQREARLRRGARRAQGRQARRDAASRAQLLPVVEPRRWARSAASSAASRPARSAPTRTCAATSGSAMQPDLRFLKRPIRRGQPPVRRLAAAGAGAGDRGAVGALRDARQPPATFRVIVNPMVTWIWIGGLIVFAGALIALWPSGAAGATPRDQLPTRPASAASCRRA